MCRGSGSFVLALSEIIQSPGTINGDCPINEMASLFEVIPERKLKYFFPSTQVYAIVVSKPKSGDLSPASVSYTAGFYHIPVIGISSRDSAFSDKVAILTYIFVLSRKTERKLPRLNACFRLASVPFPGKGGERPSRWREQHLLFSFAFFVFATPFVRLFG